MAKFPSQNKMTYQTGDVSYDGYSSIASGGQSGGLLNLPKDLSILNRRGYASTTRKGVPLVFRTKLDFFLHDEDGAYGPPSVLDNLMVTLKVSGAPNNWVMKNAAVKWHAAREGQLRAAKITKRMRGAYAHEIRYNYDGNNQTFLNPIDGDGDAFTGGTWDVTKFTTGADDDFELKIVGLGVNEATTGAATAFNIGHSYLASRATVPDDTNLEASTVPAEHSILREMILDSSGSRLGDSRTDDLIDDVQDNQDNPPYDLFVPSDTNHDITEPVELGRALSSTQAAVGSCIVDIPFGLASLACRAYTSESTSGVASVRGLIHAEVLDIFEMQG